MVMRITPQKTTSGRIFAILGVLLLVASIAPTPLVEQASAQSGSGLSITKDDYETAIGDRLFGTDAFAYVVLEDDSRSIRDARAVVRLEAYVDESSPLEFDLLETGIGTGVFKGGFGFTSGANQAAAEHPFFGKIGVGRDAGNWVQQSALLSVDDGNDVTVQVQGGSTSRTFTWYEDTPATVTIASTGAGSIGKTSSGDILGYGDTLEVEIDDDDIENAATGLDTRLLRAFSESDATGATFDIDADVDDDGNIVIAFETTLVPGNKKVYVQDGDRVFVEYTEPFTETGQSDTHRYPAVGSTTEWTFRKTSPTSVSADRSTYFGETDDTDPRDLDRAIITIKDESMRHDEGVKTGTVDFELIIGGATHDVEAAQTTGSSDTFLAEIRFETSGADCPISGAGGTYTLCVNDRSTVRASYDGKTAEFKWRAVFDAAATLKQSGITLPSGTTIIGTDETVTVEVDDKDSSRSTSKDTITVKVKSSSDPTAGLSLTLTETGSTNGLFRGTFGFTEGSTGSGNIQVADGDSVAVEYPDPFDAAGRPQAFFSPPIVWLEDDPADLSSKDIDADDPDLENVAIAFFHDADFSQSATRAHGLQQVYMRLIADEDEDETEARVVEVPVRTVGCDDAATDHHFVRLLESGPGTGVFSAPVTFDVTMAAVLCGAFSDNRVPVVNPGFVATDGTLGYGLYDLVRVHVDPTDATEAPLDTLEWHEAGDSTLTAEGSDSGSILFGEAEFSVTLIDPDGRRSTDALVATSATGYGTDAFVPGSELLFVQTQESATTTSGSGSDQRFYTLDAQSDGAAEPLVDQSGLQQPSCDDVTIVGTERTIALGTGDESDSPTDVTCHNVSNGIVTYSFDDCQPVQDQLADDVRCIATFTYIYRPAHDAGCAGSSDAFSYDRTATGIVFCGAPVSGQPFTMTFIPGERTITVRSATGEVEDVELTHSAGDSTATQLAFTGPVPVETSPSSGNGAIHVSGDHTKVRFFHEDSMRADGRPGSKTPNHFRALPFNLDWRTAETPEVVVMKHDFSGPANDVVYGPSVPVQVTNADSNLFDRRESIEVNGATLRETGQDTGVFRGMVPTSGTDPLAISFTSYNETGATVTESTSVERRLSTAAAFTLDGNTMAGVFRGTIDTFTVSITDADANMDPDTIESVKARIASELDRQGREITLVETGKDTGVFTASGLRFTTNPEQSATRLLVDDDASFWVTYADRMGTAATDGAPDLRETVHTWRSLNAGEIRFDRDYQVGTGGAHHGNATVKIADQDRNGAARQIDLIEFTDGDDASGASLSIETIGEGLEWDEATVAFVETAHNTGEFIAVFTFGKGAACEEDEDPGDPYGPAVLCVNTSENVLLMAYTDPDTVGSLDVSDDTTTWYEDDYGFIRFDRPGYGDFGTTAQVILYDEDFTEGDVLVRSDADTSGVERELDGENGVFVASVPISSSSSTSAIHVNPQDTIVAVYTKGSEERTAEAVFREGLEDPPITELVVEPTESDCEGDNEWFLCPVEVSFEVTNREPGDVDTIRYSINGAGSQVFDPSDPILIGAEEEDEGEYDFEFWSIDTLGLEGEKTTDAVKVSRIDPTADVTDIETASEPEGEVALSWEPVAEKEDNLLFHHYRIYRAPQGLDFDNATWVGNATEEEFADQPPGGDDPPQLGQNFTYFVRVANEAGRVGPLSDAVEGLSDSVAPRLDSFSVTPDVLHEEEGEDTVDAELVLEGDADNLEDVQNVTLRVTDPFGNVVEESEMNQDDSTTYSASYDEFDTCGIYNVFGVATDAVGNQGELNETVRYVALDTQAPQLVGLATQIQQGQDLNVTVRDNCAGVAAVAYTVEGGQRRTVTVPDRESGDNCTPGPCDVRFTIPANRFAVGENQVVFELEDANETANAASITRVVTMVVEPIDEEEDPLTPPSIGRTDFSRLVEYNGRFSFSVTGQVTGVTFSTPDLDLGDVLGGFTPSTGRVRVDVSGLEPGQHAATVRALNAFGEDEAELTFHVLEEGVPLPPIGVTVAKDDKGRPVVGWQKNPDSELEIGGYLVHRSSSPWRVIGVADAEATSYTDLTALPRKSYQYAVTAYGTDEQGFLAVGQDSAEQLAWFQGVSGTSFETDRIEGGIPAIVWWVALIVVAVLVVVALLYVNRRQIFGSAEEELYTEEYPDEAETPFGEERHLIRCPNCTEDFHVSGERPVVTDCPNCGRKGILR